MINKVLFRKELRTEEMKNMDGSNFSVKVLISHQGHGSRLISDHVLTHMEPSHSSGFIPDGFLGSDG